MLGVYAGSFDPFTLGHARLLQRAAKAFEKICVLISRDPSKPEGRIDPQVRADLIKEYLHEAKLDTNDKVVVRVLKPEEDGAQSIPCYAKKVLAPELNSKEDEVVLIRGARNATDFTHEMNLQEINKQDSGLDTVVFMSEPGMDFISSTYAWRFFKEARNKLLDKYLPPTIRDYLVRNRTALLQERSTTAPTESTRRALENMIGAIILKKLEQYFNALEEGTIINEKLKQALLTIIKK